MKCPGEKENVHFWAKAHRLNAQKITQWFSNDKQAKVTFYSVETGIYLLNQYVTAIYLDWNGKHIQRYSDLLCRHLGIDYETLHQQIIELALSIELPSNYQGLLSPLNRLKGLHREAELLSAFFFLPPPPLLSCTMTLSPSYLSLSLYLLYTS